MRPLPRLLAFADDRVAGLDDLGIRAAAIAAAGPGVALVARIPHGTDDRVAQVTRRFAALAAPPMASVYVTGRVDIALAGGAHGVILRDGDLAPRDARRVSEVANGNRVLHVLRSVHADDAARKAVDDGADALVVGSIWPTATHPDAPAAGPGLLERTVRHGVPVYAIGGVTSERARLAHDLGAWGVAAISAVWDADQPYRAALALLDPWREL